MSFLGERNAIALGVSQHAVLGSGPLFTQLAPSLLLQFAGAETLDSRITFTRTTTATRTNASGLIESVAINAPRFDYNPTTLAPLGLLIEEQRTNRVLNSDTLATQNVTVTAVATTLSFYGTGTVTLSGTHSQAVVGTGAYPSRRTYTFTPTAGTLTLTVSGTVQFAQLEVGGFATSYIPTAASQVTRAPDNASMTGTNFSSWYNATEGSFVTDSLVAYVDAGKFPAVFQVTDGTLGNRIDQGYTPTPNPTNLAISLFVNTGGVNQAAAYPTVTRGAPLKLGDAYKVNSFAGVANGGTVGTDSSGTVPVCTQATIGTVATSGVYLNGTIRQIVYYPRRLTNAQLQGLTR